MPRKSLEERFWAKVDRSNPDGCWPWLGVVNDGGYGIIKIQYRKTRAHRVAYELSVGPIPHGLVTDHICRNRRCVNPAHLEVVTNKENIRRGFGIPAVNGRRTHCIHGHALEGDNLKIRKADGHRVCLTCLRKHSRAWSRKRSIARQRVYGAHRIQAVS